MLLMSFHILFWAVWLILGLHGFVFPCTSQIDQWLEYAPVFSLGSAFENACKYVDEFLQSHTVLVGNYLSIADIAIWSGLAGRSF